jgi:low temperature requirement protein LtrA
VCLRLLRAGIGAVGYCAAVGEVREDRDMAGAADAERAAEVDDGLEFAFDDGDEAEGQGQGEAAEVARVAEAVGLVESAAPAAHAGAEADVDVEAEAETPAGAASAANGQGPQQSHPAEPSHGQRVSWAETFFDLVFAFAVTQVAGLAQRAGDAVSVGRAVVLFVPLWWAWVGVSIVYNGIAMTSTKRHLKLFASGLLAFVMSIEAPQAYGNRGLIFAIAYLCVRGLLYWAVWRRRLFPFRLHPFMISFTVSAPLFVVGALTALPARGWIWLAAGLIELVNPSVLTRRFATMRFESAHLPERFGLFVIIALGEVLVGVGAAESRQGLGWLQLGTLILAFVLCCALWWTYFHFAAPAMEYALREARIQSGLVRTVFSRAHLVMVIGLVLTASGLAQAVHTPLAHPSGVHSWFLGAGTALYVLTFCYTRISMFGGTGIPRLVAGLLAAAVAAAGTLLPLIATLGALVAVLIALNVFEAWNVASGRPLPVLRIGHGALRD